MDEVWKTYPSDDRYEVSSLGRVRLIATGAVRRPSVNPVSGYHVLVFSVPGSKHVGRYVHRMTLETFVGPCPDGHEVSHLNGVRSDNRLANLQYETRKDNHARKREHETDYAGGRNPSAKLSADEVRAIRAASQPQPELARKFGVSRSQIGRIKRGENWCATEAGT